MTDRNELERLQPMTTEQKALALVNECGGKHGYISRDWGPPYEALCRAIEHHEAFKREVSDAVEDYCGYVPPDSPCHPITRFIIAKPDPLVEVLDDLKDGRAGQTTESYAACLRAALAARGGRIVWEGE